MKKIIAGLIVVVIAIVLTLFIFPKKDDEVIVQINNLKTELKTSTHQNIINAGYTKMDTKDNVGLYNQKPGINLYTMEQNVKNNSVMAIGLTINDNIKTLKIDDYVY